MTPNDHHTAIIDTAAAIADVVDLESVAAHLHAALKPTDAYRLGGLLIRDDDREAVTIILTDARCVQGPSQDAPAYLFDQLFDSASEGLIQRDLPDDDLTSVATEQFTSAGARRLIATPLRQFGATIALHVAAFADADAARDMVPFVERLARLAAPAVANCLNHGRFARGDRRRDLLLDLTNELNTSLKVESVIASASRTLRQLTDLHSSAIHLLQPDGDRTRVYHQHPGRLDGSTDEAEMADIEGTALTWVVENRDTFESGDLAASRSFSEDNRLFDSGVRRYLLTPMLARGQLIGALFCASDKPLPFRRIDLWMYQNIAIQLGLAISNARQHERLLRLSDRLREQNVYLQEEIDAQHAFPDMIGRSDSIARVRKDIARVAGIESTVLIFGETGVGKELVARAIHAGGPHADQPMVKINCAAIPEGMVESELFGHERGAFTTAVAKRIGRFELARDATLFLDEIGELPLSIQAKLLRVLQDGEFERVGGSQTLVSNARIVAATNRDLEAAVAAKTFRSDLYYRLKVFPITVPPLRDRPEDISLLVNAFVAIFNRQMGKRVSTIDTAWLDDLRRRDWPGNIRELKHVIERAMISGDGPILRGEMVGATTSAPSTNAAPISVRPNVTLNELEAQHIRRVLDHTRGKIEGAHGAAVLLGLRPSTLRSRMKRLSIHRDQI